MRSNSNLLRQYHPTRPARWGAAALAAMMMLGGAATAWSATSTVVGHRGTALFAPENTSASIAVAAAGDADMVLLDVRESSDGELVVIHDETLDRTTNGTGSVNASTLAQLQALEAGTDFDASYAGVRIPTLAEAVASAQAAGLTPLVNVKTADITAAELGDELAGLGVAGTAVVQSDDWTFLTSLNSYNPTIKLAAVVTGPAPLSGTTVTQALATGADILVLDKSAVTSAAVELAHNNSLELYAGIADGAAIQQMIDLDVDAIISNDPKLASDLLGRNAYVPDALNNGIVSYWRLDDALFDAVPAAARDSRGDDPGQVVNSPSWSASQPDALFGGAVKFQGTNDVILIPSSPRMDIGTSGVAVSLWVKLDELPAVQTVNFAGIYDSVEDSYVIYSDKTNNELRTKISAGAHAARPGVPASVLNTSDWHHVVAVYDGGWGPLAGETRIYMDGKLWDCHIGNDNSNPPKGMTGIVKPAQIAAIGRNGSQAAGYFNGKVDDVAIWNRSLSTAEILEIYNAGVTGDPLSSLVTVKTPAEHWSLYE